MGSNGNGAADGAPPMPTPQDVANANAVLAQIQPAIKTFMAVGLRGLMASFPGVRADAVASMAAFELAQTIGGAFAGDLVPVLQIRKACQDAFTEGMRKSPAPKPAAPPQMPHGIAG